LKQQKKPATINWESYPLINLPHIRQNTDYTCGAAALMAVLQYYRLYDETEAELAIALNATEDWGTEPEAIVEIASSYGIQAIYKQCTLDEIMEDLHMGWPTIILYQAWSDNFKLWKNDWDDGHYSVIVGIDHYNVYLEDPSLPNEIGYIPRDEFLERWHDIDKSNNKLIHMGIKCRHPLKPNVHNMFRKID